MSDISYITLRKIQQAEKNSSTLTKIDRDFYRELSSFLLDLNNKLLKEDSPKRQLLLREELQSIEKIATSIYEQREKKILIAAMTKSRGGNPNIKNLIDGEEELFKAICDILTNTRIALLKGETSREKQEEETLENRVEEETTGEEEEFVDEEVDEAIQVTLPKITVETHLETEVESSSKVDHQKGEKKDKIPSLEEFQENKKIGGRRNNNPIIRVSQDIPSFIGTDKKTYHLKRWDIISIPKDMCETLTKRGVARKIVSKFPSNSH